MQLSEFRNEPLSDFKGNPEHSRRMKEALEQVASEFGREYGLVIGGETIKTEEVIKSHNPARKDQVVGVVSKADQALAERAIQAADNAFKTWSRTPATKRAEALLEVGKLIRSRKYYFEAWLVYEVGKTWAEADADVAEAIDFCEYYSREMLRMEKPQPLTPVPGERNLLRYIPLGVGIVIPPWNFPLAILSGMTLASVVTGNAVVMKPSSDSPVIAAKFMEVVAQAGVPAGVVNYLPGSGAAVGDYLVGHARTRFVAFTGSKQVGLRINELAAKPAKSQVWVKRVVVEMGRQQACPV